MIYTDILLIEGAKIGDLNPIPQLREIGDRKSIPVSEQFDSEEQKYFGEYSNARMLPYLEQNGYTRTRTNLEVKTIVIENNILRVTFLPDYGGRVYSIYNKKKKQELLYKNNILQPANLSIRNAWFSGGIEWNIGHLGHSCLTCEPVHFGKVILNDGSEILRMYEFERMQQLYYQIDFYLEEDSDTLVTHTKIINTSNLKKPLYYWVNIAINEAEGVRVFSDTRDVIYIKPYLDENGKMVNTFAKGELPYLEGIEGDATYPTTFMRSNEYFYQNTVTKPYPFEAAVFPDGYMFFETSTQPLNYRKMFCWGRHKGGKTWQSYLSGSEKEAYLEVQAGVAPTQLHVAQIEENSEVTFMQLFGGIWIENPTEREKFHVGIKASMNQVKDCINQKLRNLDRFDLEQTMEVIACRPIDQIIHYGHNFGYLEEKKWKFEKHRSDFVTSMSFKINSNYIEELNLEYLLDLYYGRITAEDIPVFSLNLHIPCIMTDLEWEIFYVHAVEADIKNRAWYLYHLGVMYYENGALTKAENALRQIFEIEAYAIVALTLGSIYQRLKKYEQSIHYTELGISYLSHVCIDRFEANAYLQLFRLLSEMQLFSKMWDVYEEMREKELDITEEILIFVALSAYELEKWDELDPLFELSLDRIREGDNSLVEIWYKRQWKKGLVSSLEEARVTLTAPKNIDFRML